MKTEDILKYIDTRKKELEDIIDRCQYAGADYEIPDNRLQEILSLESKIKESQMEHNGPLISDVAKAMETTTPKPFDIDRCLNEDGGRCIHRITGFGMILLSPKLTENNHYVVDDGFKTLSFAFPNNLQNIPRRKEEWINVWKDISGKIICTDVPFNSKQDAMMVRCGNNYDYIGDPICISSEEV